MHLVGKVNGMYSKKTVCSEDGSLVYEDTSELIFGVTHGFPVLPMPEEGPYDYAFKIHALHENFRSSNNSERLRIDASGNVSIGTSSTQGFYKLAVKGSMVAEDIWVKPYSTWPDYVFKESYNLVSLNELKIYISKHKHLPGVPDQKYIENNGQNVGEMNRILLEKVEELTLYIFNLNERLELLEKENQKLMKSIKK